MARYFTVPDTRFDTDFIFQPDWDLAEKALLKRDADRQAQIEQINLLRNVDFNYDPNADFAHAMQVKEQWDNDADNLAREINEAGSDWGSMMLKVNDYANKLAKDRKFGDIAQLESHYATLNKFRDIVAKSPNPATQDMYGRLLSDYYNSVGGFGAKTNPFSQTFYEDEGYQMDGFLESPMFEKLKADINSNLTFKGGQFLISSGEKLTDLDEERIADAYRAYINANPNIKGLFGILDRYGQNPGTYLDSEGEIAWGEGSTLGNILAQTSIYRQHDKEDLFNFHGQNKFALENLKSNLRIGEWKTKNDLLPHYGAEDVDEYLNNVESLVKEEMASVEGVLGTLKNALDDDGMMAVFGSSNINEIINDVSDYQTLYTRLKGAGLSDATLEIVEKARDQYSAARKAGNQSLKDMGVSDKIIEDVHKSFEERLPNLVQNGDMKIKGPRTRDGKDIPQKIEILIDGEIYEGEYKVLDGSINETLRQNVELKGRNSGNVAQFSFTNATYLKNSASVIPTEAMRRNPTKETVSNADVVGSMKLDYTVSLKLKDAKDNLVDVNINSRDVKNNESYLLPTIAPRFSYDARLQGAAASAVRN